MDGSREDSIFLAYICSRSRDYLKGLRNAGSEYGYWPKYKPGVHLKRLHYHDPSSKGERKPLSKFNVHTQ